MFGLFNNSQAQPTQQPNSLFNPTAQAQPTGGGLFGAQPQSNAPMGGAMGGALFGQKPAQPSNSGGLFGNLLGGGGSQQQQGQNSFMNPGQPQPQQGGGLFGGIATPAQNTNPGGGLFGGGFGTNPPASNTFGLGGGTNTQTPAGSFGQGGGLFGSQQPAQPNTGGGGVFGGGTSNNAPTLGGGLFGQGNNNNQQGSNPGGGLFGGGGSNNFNMGNNASPFGGGGLGLGTTPSFGLGGGAMGVGGQVVGAGGTIGTPYDRAQTKRGNENCWVQSVNAMPAYKDKNLGELRLEDYKLIREGRIPDEMKMLLANGQSLATYQPKPQGSQSFGMGASQAQSNTGFGLFGGGAQPQNPSAGIFNQGKPAATGGGIFSNTPQQTNNFFNSMTPQNQQSNTPQTPLFGGGFGQQQQQPQTTAPQTSLFGGGNSVFGNTQNNQNKPAGTGLFTSPNPTPQGGLFGSTSLTGGGLGQPTTSGGLFASTQPLLGAATTQPNNFGQSFMSKPGEQPGQTTGLFSNMQASQPQTGGLFSFGATQPQQSSLFPSNNTGLTQNNSGLMPQPQGLQLGSSFGQPSMPFQGSSMTGFQNNPPLGNFNQFNPNDPGLNSNLSLFNTPMFSNSPTQSNWPYHDWNREYQNFYGSNLNDVDDMSFFPYNPYKKKTNFIRNPNLTKNFTISRRPEAEKHCTEKFDHSLFAQFEKRVTQEERKPPQKDFMDKEPQIVGYQHEKPMASKSLNPINEEKVGFAADKQRIQELMDPTIRLLVEMKGPKQGTFTVDCDLDVSIGEMKLQILEILEKCLSKPFISQEKFFKIMVTHPEKGLIVLNDNQTIGNYQLKNNQTITLIKDLSLEEDQTEDNSAMATQYRHQLAPENMIPILTKPGYSLDPSLRQLSRMNEEQLKRVENFTIRNEFATVKFEGFTDVRGLDLDKIVNFQHRMIELYPEEVYNEENRPPRGRGLNKPAILVYHKFDYKPKEGVSIDKILKKIRKWVEEKLGMEFMNFDFEHQNLLARVSHF